MTFEAGRTKTGGRQAGTRNKASAIARASAEPHLTRMIEILADIAEDETKPGNVRVMAAREVIHLASGRPMVMETIPDVPPTPDTQDTQDKQAALRKIREEIYGLPPDTDTDAPTEATP